MILCCLCDVENNIENKTIFFNIDDKNKERKRGIFCSSRFFKDFLVLLKRGREGKRLNFYFDELKKSQTNFCCCCCCVFFYFLK